MEKKGASDRFDEREREMEEQRKREQREAIAEMAGEPAQPEETADNEHE